MSIRAKLSGPKRAPLPALPQVGDRIKLAEDRVHELRRACKLAGFDVTIDKDRVLTVAQVNEKGRESPHGRVLIVEEFRQPTFWSEDAVLAWERNSKERRAALIAAGSWREPNV